MNDYGYDRMCKVQGDGGLAGTLKEFHNLLGAPFFKKELNKYIMNELACLESAPEKVRNINLGRFINRRSRPIS